MERGGRKIRPITTKDVRDELHTQSTTFTRPTWLVVLQLIMSDGTMIAREMTDCNSVLNGYAPAIAQTGTLVPRSNGAS